MRLLDWLRDRWNTFWKVHGIYDVYSPEDDEWERKH